MCCPACQANVPDGAAYCSSCGTQLVATGATTRLPAADGPATPPAPSNCQRCGGAMEVGFVPDRGHANVRSLGIWVAGMPKAAFWSGVNTDGRRYHLEGWRCTRCGLVEFYAYQQTWE